MIDAAVIEQCARAILAACPAGSRVILFGSRARGNANPDSDVDFMVVEPEVPSRMSEAARLARVIRPWCVAADIVVVDQDTYERWKDEPNSVVNEAAIYGRVLA
jgi:uncharacterized protein